MEGTDREDIFSPYEVIAIDRLSGWNYNAYQLDPSCLDEL